MSDDPVPPPDVSSVEDWVRIVVADIEAGLRVSEDQSIGPLPPLPPYPDDGFAELSALLSMHIAMLEETALNYRKPPNA